MWSLSAAPAWPNCAVGEGAGPPPFLLAYVLVKPLNHKMNWNETARILWLHQSEAASGIKREEGNLEKEGNLKKLGKGGLGNFWQIVAGCADNFNMVHYSLQAYTLEACECVCVCALVHVHVCVCRCHIVDMGNNTHTHSLTCI